MSFPKIYKLADFPFILVGLRCDTCKRAGAYKLARLATKFGSEITLDDLLVRLSADCPWRDEPRGRQRIAMPIKANWEKPKLAAICPGR